MRFLFTIDENRPAITRKPKLSSIKPQPVGQNGAMPEHLATRGKKTDAINYSIKGRIFLAPAGRLSGIKAKVEL